MPTQNLNWGLKIFDLVSCYCLGTPQGGFDLEDSLRQVKHDRGKAAINREGEASNAARPLEVTLKYFKNIPAIRGIQQISRPGNRTYINVKRILKYSVEQN